MGERWAASQDRPTFRSEARIRKTLRVLTAVGAAGFGIYDNVCILAGAATIPEARNQGVQNALLDARLRLARESGCSLAMICALPGSQSQKNAQKNGFNIAYTRTKWQLLE